MSEIKRGVMEMPFELAMGTNLSRRQFYAIAREIYAENESLRKALRLAKPCVERDMNAAVKNNFGFVDNDPWACAAVDARDAIVEVLNRSPENPS